MIDSVLIANRGEVAARIARTARLLGIRSVTVHSDADAGGSWTRLSDETYNIGPAVPHQSYLDVERLLAVAGEAGVAAIHPGYGFLAEDAGFASAVQARDLIFVGPPPHVIAAMADKSAARAVAAACGVPIVPGSAEPVDDVETAQRIAETLGWPVILKPTLGGGGRGIRVAADPALLAAAFEESRREAGLGLSSVALLIERFIGAARHIEVQVLADRAGGLLILGDRDCSLQRRRQKVIEEAPAPLVGEQARQAMHDAAAAIARHVGYEGAGTVEFLFDPASGEFFFLEMNTRLQVEHGVTELVTGIDIVEQQFRIASGEPLAMRPVDARPRGHAIEARITAEDAARAFLPSPGSIERLTLPCGPWVRSDFGVATGDEVTLHYDSMLGKILAWGVDRDSVRRRLDAALAEFRLDGVIASPEFLRRLLALSEFVEARHHVGTLEQHLEGLTATLAPLDPEPRGGARVVSLPWGTDRVSVAIHASQNRSGTLALRVARAVPGQETKGGGAAGTITAPMDATVSRLLVEAGASVVSGTALIALEAMKMELVVRAPCAGTLRSLEVAAGVWVPSGARLALIDPEA